MFYLNKRKNTLTYSKNEEKANIERTSVVDMRAELVGGGGGPTCIKIGYSSREPRRVLRPFNKIGYSSAMY